MPYSSLNDPHDLARVTAALDATWDDVRDQVPEGDRNRERGRLAYIVSSLFPHGKTDAELKLMALERFRQGLSITDSPALPLVSEDGPEAPQV